jgi:hypothetical protein
MPMVILKPEQERILIDAINSGLARTTDEALDQALEALRGRLAGPRGKRLQSKRGQGPSF